MEGPDLMPNASAFAGGGGTAVCVAGGTMLPQAANDASSATAASFFPAPVGK